MNRQPRVQDVEFHLYLGQVEPGTERDVAQQLEKAGVPYWHVLGKYDLLCLSPETLRKEIHQEWFERYGVDWVEMTAFAWQREDNEDALRYVKSAGRAADWIAVTLAKLDPGYLFSGAKAPVDLEEEFALKVQTDLRRDGTQALALGGLGWHELIILIWDDDAAALARRVIDLNSAPPDDKGRREVLKTFTIFALHKEFLLPDAPRKWSRIDQNTGRDLRPLVMVTCRNEPSSVVRSKMLDALPALGLECTIGAIFGTADILIVPAPAVGLGSLVRAIVDMRTEEHLGRYIYSTSTLLDLQYAGPPQEAARPPHAPMLDRELRELLDRKKLGLHMERRQSATDEPRTYDVHRNTQQMNAMIRSSLRNELTRDAYLDMVFALHAFATSEASQADRLTLNAVRAVLDYTSLGYQQRCLGMLTALWNVGNPTPMFYRGGIQRVLWAADYVCYSLLQQHGKEWTGFTVFGMVRDYLRSHLGIVSLPYRTMFSPCDWWGVFHEIGHEYVHQALREMGQDTWRELVCAVYGIVPPGVRSRDSALLHYENVCWETLADIFDYAVGFEADWDQYQDTVLGYVMLSCLPYETELDIQNFDLSHGTRVRSRFEFYLARLCAVCLWRDSSRQEPDLSPEFCASFGAGVLHALERSFESAGVPRRRRALLLRELKSALTATEVLRVAEDYRVGQLLGTPEGREILGKLLPRLPAQSADVQTDLAALSEGVVLRQVANPQGIIRGLLARASSQRAPELTPRVRMAALLSLWNAYAGILPERIRCLVAADPTGQVGD